MKIDHIAIWSTDIEKLRSFYIDYFGAGSNERYENRGNGFSSYFLSFDSGCRLELMQMDSIPPNSNDVIRQYQGLIHMAISVEGEEQVRSLTERLRGDGYTVVSEPRRTGDGYYESCILDPDQNRVEIVGDFS